MSPSIEPSYRGLITAFLKTIIAPLGITLIALGVSAEPEMLETPGVMAGLGWMPVATSTATPTATLTPSPTLSPTSTFTPTPTATATPEPTATPGPTATAAPRPRPQPDGVKRSARVPILMYHYISAPPDPNDVLRIDLSVPPEDFDAQMKWLADNNYHTITLTDLYYYLAVGEPLPENPIIITLDDGYVDHHENAFPILQKYRFVGTFFVLAGPADVASPPYLTWDMIAEMSAAGQDIQVHGRNHVDMRRRPGEFLFFQIVGARQAIEAHTGKPAPFFSYPAGRYDADLLRFLDERGFWMAVTTNGGRIHTLDAPLELTRIRIRGADTLERFIAKVTAGE